MGLEPMTTGITITFKTYADGYSRKVSTCETFKCPKNRPTSPPLKQWAMNYAFQCFISGLAAPSMFPRWTKSFILKASSRPAFGSVQSRFGFGIGMGGTSFFSYAFSTRFGIKFWREIQREPRQRQKFTSARHVPFACDIDEACINQLCFTSP